MIRVNGYIIIMQQSNGDVCLDEVSDRDPKKIMSLSIIKCGIVTIHVYVGMYGYWLQKQIHLVKKGTCPQSNTPAQIQQYIDYESIEERASNMVHNCMLNGT